MAIKMRFRFPVAAVFLAVVGLPGSVPALAQHGGAAESDRNLALEAGNGVIRMGKTWNQATFDETLRLYTAAHRDIEWPGLLEAETYSYGSHAQQNFELFRPEQGFSEPGPVFLFMHGNGLGADDWRIPSSDGLLLTHAGRLAATAGGIGVLMNYRTGEAASPLSGSEDLRLVVEWLKENIAEYGGDPDTLVLVANSEAALHAAAYLFDQDAQPVSGPGLAAVVLSSGIFGDAAPHLYRLIDDYQGPRVPLALWSAQYDVAPVEIGIVELYGKLCRKYQDCPWYEQLYGHNHMSHILSFGTSDSSASNAFIRFYHTVR